MQGRLEVRYPTQDEVAADLGAAPGTDLHAFLPQDPEMAESPGISLKQAGKASVRAKEGDDDSNAFFAEMAANRQQRREVELRQQRSEAAYRARRMLRFDGGVRLMIAGDAFERSRELRERYPVDQGSGRIGLDVPLRGTLPELTLTQAEEILRLDQQRD
jgi:hypothetical protein